MSPLHNGMKVDDHEENGLVGADELFDPAPEDEIVLTVIFLVFYFLFQGTGGCEVWTE